LKYCFNTDAVRQSARRKKADPQVGFLLGAAA
jgi:hypothetical protein